MTLTPKEYEKTMKALKVRAQAPHRKMQNVTCAKIGSALYTHIYTHIYTHNYICTVEPENQGYAGDELGDE